jgi:transcriptional regulator with GAF, ATPase, and Fis domain
MKTPRRINQNPAGLVSVCYGPSTCLERRKESTVIPFNQGIAYEAIIKKKIAYSNDVKNDQRFWPFDQKINYAETRYRTIIACPVITNKVVCGVLCFDWREQNMYCKDYDQILACFTDIVSLACYICNESRNVIVKDGVK